MDQQPPSTIEGTIAIYGIPDHKHSVLSREAAEQLTEQMRGKTVSVQESSAQYRVSSTRLEGDEQRGHVVAIFEQITEER